MSNPEAIASLLAEQVAYCGAISLAAALEAYQSAGRLLKFACGPGVWTELCAIMRRVSPLLTRGLKCWRGRRHALERSGCASSRPTFSVGRRTSAMISSSWASGSHRCHLNDLSRSGQWWPMLWFHATLLMLVLRRGFLGLKLYLPMRALTPFTGSP